MIAQSSISQVRREVNIYDVVSPVVQLKRAGRQFRGLSPFTQEKTPSFYIDPEKNVFYCYSSSQGGDVVRFVQLYEHLNFGEAVEALAERFHIALEYEKGDARNQGNRSLRKELLDLHAWLGDFYWQQFKADTSIAKAVRQYWTDQRGFPLDLAETYHIGFAPPGGDALAAALRKQSFGLEALRVSGLFYLDKRKAFDLRRLRPRFRGRLMVPIRNYQGQVIAFCGRQLDVTPADDPAHAAKYINSPETSLFHKGGTVFGLDVAREQLQSLPSDARASFVLVEGQLDALRCWQHGITNAVAPQGTAVTEGQLYLLKRYADHLDCVLDGDAAGQRAALRLLPIALKVGLEVRFLPLPGGADPDSLLREGGPAAFAALSKASLSAMSFAAQTLLGGPNPSPMQCNKVRQQIFAMIAECDQEDLRQYYLQEAGRHLKLLEEDDRAVNRDFRQFLYRRRHHRPDGPGMDNGEARSASSLTTAEYELLLCVFHFPQLAYAVAEVIDIQWVNIDFTYGKLLIRVVAQVQEGLWEDENHYDQLWENDDEQNQVYALLAKEFCFEDPLKVTNDCLKRILDKYVKKRVAKLEEHIKRLPMPSTEFPRCQKEIIALRQLRQKPPRIRLSQPLSQ